MANYTISTYTALEYHSNTVADGNIVSPTLTITPKAGYVIRARDFSIHNAARGGGADINKWTGGDLPASIASVTFVDLDANYTEGVGYSRLNTIRVDIAFAAGFKIKPDGSNAQDHNISLDIDGAAHIFENVINVPIDIDLSTELVGTNYNITSLATGLSLTNNQDGSAVSAASQIAEVNISGNLDISQEQIEQNEIIIAEITIDVQEEDLSTNFDSGDSNNDDVDDDISNTGIIGDVIIQDDFAEEDPTTMNAV
jgi:hypothetical protein